MKRLQEIRARLTEIKEELEAHTTDETRDESSDEWVERFEALTTEFDELVEEGKPLEERQAKLETVRLHTVAHVDGVDQSDPLGTEQFTRDNNVWDLDSLTREQDITNLRVRATTAVEKTRGLSDSRKESVTDLIDRLDADDDSGAGKIYRHIVAVSAPEYQKAWTRAMKRAITGRHPNPEDITVLERAMSLTDAAGGYAVPLPVDPTLNITGDGSANPFRQISRVVPITTDVLRTVNAGATSFSFDAEATEVSDDASTFANIDITAHKAQGFIPFSIEIGQDYPNFTADMNRLMAEGRDDLEATAFATGTGTNQPVGIVTALTGTSSEYSSDTTDTFAAVDVYNAEDNLGDKWLSRAVFVANKAIYNDVRQFATDDGHSLWERIGSGQPAELLGYPTFRASGMDGSITAAAENYVLILGDFSTSYVIANRIGFSVELVPHLFATANNLPSGQRGLYAYWRVGADSVNDDAFVMLNVT